MKASRFRRLINWYPPYLGAGVHVGYVSEDFHRVEVSMKLRWYNRNYVGTHFGGSLYAMVDPFHMLMLLNILGKDYIVWDRAASIDFRKPGRGRVSAVFELSPEVIETIRRETAGGQKYVPVYSVDIVDEEGVVVASVSKTLYIKLKPTKPERA